MKKPKVLNKNKLKVAPPKAVYVGRPSRWGNRFVEGRDGTRAEVIAAYEADLLKDPERMAALPELHGRDLLCWCAPKVCHADVLLRLANPEPEEQLMFDVLLDVQRCSKCGQDRLPVMKNLGETNETKVCSWCGAENSFD